MRRWHARRPGAGRDARAGPSTLFHRVRLFFPGWAQGLLLIIQIPSVPPSPTLLCMSCDSLRRASTQRPRMRDGEHRGVLGEQHPVPERRVRVRDPRALHRRQPRAPGPP